MTHTHNLFFLNISVSRLKRVGHLVRMEEDWNAFKIIIGKSTGKERLVGLVVSMSDY